MTESCKADKVNPLAYLTYVLSKARNQPGNCQHWTSLRPHTPPQPAGTSVIRS